MDSDTEPKLISLLSRRASIIEEMDPDREWQMTSLAIQIIHVVSSMDMDSQPKPESELMSLVSQAISAFNSMDLDSQPKLLSDLTSAISEKISLANSIDSDIALELHLKPEPKLMSLFKEIWSLEPEPELISLISKICSLFVSPYSDSEPDSDSEPESKLISLITKLMSVNIYGMEHSAVLFSSIQIITLVMSMDLESEPKPESKLMSLVSQTVSVFKSMDLNSQPKPLSKLISFITQNISMELSLYPSSVEAGISPVWKLSMKFCSLLHKTMDLKPEPELISLIYQIFSLVISMNSNWNKLISVSPQLQLRFEEEEENFFEVVPFKDYSKWYCLYGSWEKFGSRGKDATHFFCQGCNGKNHEEYEKALFEIKHPLHAKHSLQLVLLKRCSTFKKTCYCCDQLLEGGIYYCSACNFAIAFTCVEKRPVLSIDYPKWHEHPLALFPRKSSLICDLCALSDSSCPFYICPPCDFVVHRSCVKLPKLIRISRHLHRISFTPSFGQGDWSCGVCRRKIDNDYGGYFCIKEGCSYAAHSKCATQENVWDGIDLEGIQEEIEEVLDPFVRISDGIIRHFSHEHHHLILDENIGRDYDDSKVCHACITPIYFGNFYSCMQCKFILHETCANLSRKIYHPLHPHLLTLVTKDSHTVSANNPCSACPWPCTGFFYACDIWSCFFKVHVQCATISEPLVHESHKHPLFLTSKPGERRTCGVCERTAQTFNCIECDFALCFACATLPQKVRYRHDKHMLTLSYGDETSTMMLWCEACEGRINPMEQFYKCDEYCCVTLHTKCLVGKDLYMWPGLSLIYMHKQVKVRLNNHRMSRPHCKGCEDGKRCLYRYVIISDMTTFCSISCCIINGTKSQRSN